MVVCRNGHSNRDGAKFCLVCGVPLAAASPLPPPGMPPPPPVGLPPQPADPMRAAVPPAPAIPQTPAAAAGLFSALRIPFGLIPAVPGLLMVVAGFFLAWLVVSSPAAVFLGGQAASASLSGANLLTDAPATYRSVPTAIICLVPFIGALAVLSLALTMLRRIPARILYSLGAIVLALIGVIFMIALLSSARAQPAQIIQSYGIAGELAQLLSDVAVHIDPGAGFWATVLGFILIGIGGAVDFFTQMIWR